MSNWSHSLADIVAPDEEEEHEIFNECGYEKTDHSGPRSDGVGEDGNFSESASSADSEVLRLALRDKSDECQSLSSQLSALKELLRHSDDGSLISSQEAIGQSVEGQSQSVSSSMRGNLSERRWSEQPSGMLDLHESLAPVARPQSLLEPNSTSPELPSSGGSCANTNNENESNTSFSSEILTNEDEAISKVSMAEVAAEAEVLRRQVKELEKSTSELRVEKERLSGSIADRQKQWDHSLTAKELEIGQLKEIISQVCAVLGMSILSVVLLSCFLDYMDFFSFCIFPLYSVHCEIAP